MSGGQVTVNWQVANVLRLIRLGWLLGGVMLSVELFSDAFLLLFASLIANQAKVFYSGQTERSQNRCSRTGIVVKFSSAFYI